LPSAQLLAWTLALTQQLVAMVAPRSRDTAPMGGGTCIVVDPEIMTLNDLDDCDRRLSAERLWDGMVSSCSRCGTYSLVAD